MTEQVPNLDAARQLQKSLEEASLHILDHRNSFNKRSFEPLDGEDEDALKDPAVLATDVASQIAFLRKLKFQYLEQNAKDKYIKIIVSDEAPLITAADNEELRVSNEKKKEILKVAKAKLAEKYQDIRTLAPLVEEDFHKAKTLTDEAADLTQKILDARLALKRLRQAHPSPRLTVPSAEAKLDSQIEEMRRMDSLLQETNENVTRVKEKVKDKSRNLERLKVDRAEAERDVKAGQMETEDSRVSELYEWYRASLALHRSMHSLVSCLPISENELHLEYLVHSSTKQKDPCQVIIKVFFLPNTRKLANAQVQGPDVDMGDIIDAYVKLNDVPGLVAAVLARCAR